MGKRSRIYRSSSLGEASVLDQMIPASDPGENWEKRWNRTPPPPPPPPPALPGPPQWLEMDLEEPPQAADPVVTAVLAGALWNPMPRPLPPPLFESSSPPRRRPASVFSLGSPFNEPGAESSGPAAEGRGFLQACFLCRKPMQKDQTVYMFGHLRAFCSRRCQTQQIRLEGLDVDANYDGSEKNGSGTYKRSNPKRSK